MNILILGGAGPTGRQLTQYLIETTDADIILAGRSLERTSRLAGQFNQQTGQARVSARVADAADSQSLIAALEGVQLMVVAAPTTRYAGIVADAALAAGVDYLDVQFDASKLSILRERAAAIEAQGRCFITEAGYHPGLPSVLVRAAASHLDQIEEAIVGCYLNMGKDLPYTDAVDEVVNAFRDYQGQVYTQGAWTKPGSYHQRKIAYGGQIGTRNSFSMFFEEMRDLPGMLPSLREMGFYLSESHWLVDWVITPVIFAAARFAPDGVMHQLGKLMWWGMQTFPEPPYLVLLTIRACGLANDVVKHIQISVAHPDGYALTAIPVAACIRQYIDGIARKPGLWMMGHIVDPVRLLDDMQAMGVKVTTQEG